MTAFVCMGFFLNAQDRIMRARNARHKVYFHLAVLRIQHNTAEPEEILNDAMLCFANILKLPKVDAFMIIKCDKGLLHSVNFPVCHNDNVQKVTVKPHKKIEMRSCKQSTERKKERPLQAHIVNHDEAEEENPRADDDGAKEEALE